MARLAKGINGPIVGKVGTVTGSHRNGKGYIKANNVRTAPQTENELVAKERFATAHRFLKPLLAYIRKGFLHQPKKGFNGAKSHTLLHALAGEPMNSHVDPAMVKISEGELPLSENLSVSQRGNELVFTWDTEIPEGAKPYDQLMPLAYDVSRTNPKAYYNTTGAFRNSGTHSLEVWAKSGSVYHVYAAFTAADRSVNSTSVYLGTIEMN